MSSAIHLFRVSSIGLVTLALGSCSDSNDASEDASETVSGTAADTTSNGTSSSNGASASNTSSGSSDTTTTAATSGGGTSATSAANGSQGSTSAGAGDSTTATSSGNVTGGTDGTSYSDTFTGGEFHLGPVDWAETEWHNSCSPYPEQIQQIEGDFLAGLELTHNGDGQLCDACVEIVADTGKSIVARVVTTGVTTPNSIDLSPEAFAALDSGEYPRAMTWQVVKCPDTGNIYYQYQTEANVWWTSLWVRNARVPIEKVEVQSANHSSWFALTRGSDGTYTDNGGFGEGPFTLRITGVDGQTLQHSFDSFDPGDLVESSGNFE